MTDTIGVVISVIAALGFGGIVGAFVQAYLQQRRYVRTREQNFKQTRYLAILILMLTQLDPKTGLGKTRQFRNDLTNLDDVKKEIETEFLHSFVFASDDVIRSLSEFIRNPNRGSFVRVAVAMRRDLWGKRSKVTENVLDAFNKNETELFSVSSKDTNEKEDSQSNKLLEYIAEGGLYGGIIAILGIGIASFYVGWMGVSVVMLLLGLLLFIFEGKKLNNILNPDGAKSIISWERYLLFPGMFFVLIALMGLIDHVKFGIPKPIPDPYWLTGVEGAIGFVLTAIGFLLIKAGKK